MLNLRRNIRRQSGDTIVEVIIVLAVLGLAIGISYATANRSLQATRQAEENTQATEILQGQLESLRSYAGINDSANSHYVYQASNAFCIDSTGNVVKSTMLSNLDVASATHTDIPTNYPGGCHVNNLYDIAIGYDESQTETFTARVTWDDVTGVGKDTVTLVYRLHKP